ncbi:DNA cytosine methyltransferase [Paenibacillus sp.]|uniref:DNA cytosine methyltransferase n=1 Tax=Paenibacillus sp. TaxID=58172 RepID=UPI0034648268
MNKLSLFSGIGGIDLAAEWAGMETVAFCEREPFPQRVLRKHWPDTPIYDDVCELTREVLERDGIITNDRAIDIISAGYPCQPESTAGKRRGKEDDRWLWPEVARLLSDIRPRWFLGENVAGHITMGLSDVLTDLESLGYKAQAIVIPACAVGAPHRRDRVFILGNAKGEQSRGTEERATGSSETLADTKSNGRNYGEDSENKRTSNREINASANTGSSSSENVADTASIRQSGSRKSFEPSYKAACGNGEASKFINVRFGQERSTQPGLGGVLNGLSNWLDGYRWPAALGQPQHEWEPPRVATGVKDRVGRLKALGNAVNPVQVYPILAAIKAIDDMGREGRA